MTTVSDAGEFSAVNTWLAAGIAKGQPAEAAKAAAKAAAEAANPGSTVVQLSEEAKARIEADDWYTRSKDAIHEKTRLAKMQWAPAVIADGEDRDVQITKLANASAAEKEALVQRGLIDFDEGIAEALVSLQHQELVVPGSTSREGSGLSEKDIARMRGSEEAFLRSFIREAEWIHAGRPGKVNVHGGKQSAASAAPVQNTEQPAAAAQQADLERTRQDQGASTVAATDSAAQRYALDIPGLSELLAAAQRRIDALQSEYGTLLEVWKAAADRGEKWALPHVPDPSADNTGVNPFRYEESHEEYAPNIVGLPLETVKWSLGVVESDLKNPEYAGYHFHSRYGDQVISDMKSYVDAAKDYIGKLESGASPTATDATNGTE